MRGSPSTRGREKLLAFAVSVLLGALSTFEYVKVSYDKCFPEFPAWHHAHMTNHAAAPLQYRVLSYLIPEALRRAGVPIGVAYVVERGVFLAAASYVFFLFCRAWLSIADGIFASTLLMFFYTLSSFPHIQPSEEINLFAFALALLFIQRGQFAPLLATIAVAALNKETIGFLIPFYFLWERRKGGDSWSLYARCAALSGALATVYVGLRIGLGANRPYMDGLWQLRHNVAVEASDPFLGLIFLLPSLGPALWIFRRRRSLDPFFVAFLPSLGLFVVAHLAISHVDEFRTYAPLALMTIPAGILLGRREGAGRLALPPLPAATSPVTRTRTSSTPRPRSPPSAARTRASRPRASLRSLRTSS
jgi:hypothetical protein